MRIDETSAKGDRSPRSRCMLSPYNTLRTAICAGISQRGYSPFVYRDGTGWPASLPYIRKIHVSVAIGTQSGIRLHKRVPMVGVLKK